MEATERVNPKAVDHVERTNAKPVRHCFRYLNGVPLDDTHFDLEVNFLEYWERRPNGKELHFTWVTDLPIDETRGMVLMRAGRARYRIARSPSRLGRMMLPPTLRQPTHTHEREFLRLMNISCFRDSRTDTLRPGQTPNPEHPEDFGPEFHGFQEGRQDMNCVAGPGRCGGCTTGCAS